MYARVGRDRTMLGTDGVTGWLTGYQPVMLWWGGAVDPTDPHQGLPAPRGTQRPPKWFEGPWTSGVQPASRSEGQHRHRVAAGPVEVGVGDVDVATVRADRYRGRRAACGNGGDGIGDGVEHRHRVVAVGD